MTAEDIRIGKAATGTQTDIAVAVASGVFLAADATRIAIILTPSLASAYTVSSAGTAVLNRGVNVPAAGAPIACTVAEYGSWVTGALTAIGAGAVTVSIITVTSTAG